MALWSSSGKKPAPSENDSVPQPRPDDGVRLAVLAPAVYAMDVDGKKHAAEKLQLEVIHRMSPVFSDLKKAEFDALVAAIEADLQKRGAEAVIRDAAAQLSAGLRETAYAFAVRMLIADQSLAAKELHAKRLLEKELKLGAGVADEIYGVMLILLRTAED